MDISYAMKNIITILIIMFLLPGLSLAGRSRLQHLPIDLEGQVVSWTWEENTGSETVDLSGNANTGDISNGLWAEGLIGKCIDYNGTNASTWRADNATFVDFTEITIIALVYPDVSLSDVRITAKWSGGALDEFLLSVKSLRPNFGLWPTGGLCEALSPAEYAMPVKDWSVVMMIWNGTKLKGYVNNQLAVNANCTGTQLKKAGVALAVGTTPTKDGRWWNGKIDEFTIMYRAISDGERDYYYNLLRGAYRP